MSMGIFRKIKRMFLPNYFIALQKNIDELYAINREQARMLQDLSAKLEETFWYISRNEVKTETLRAMWTAENMSKYEDISDSKLYRHIKGLRDLLKTKRPVGKKLIRTGRSTDGGYVMLDDLASCRVAYSFGISDDVSWDKSMAELGMDVYMYDHTIDGLPEENPHFHWHKTGLAGSYDGSMTELETLPRLLEANGHVGERNMILKMDIEGAEWDVFAKLPQGFLGKFDQILLELHDMILPERYQEIVQALEKLNETHQLAHVHGNNCAPYLMAKGLVMPNALECLYVSKDKYQFKKDETFYPDELDTRNDDRFPDIMMGRWG